MSVLGTQWSHDARLVARYRDNIRGRRQQSLRALGIAVGPQRRTGFVASESAAEDAARLDRLFAYWRANTSVGGDPQKDEGVMDEEKALELSLRFLKAADDLEAELVAELLAAGAPIDFQHPDTLETATHLALARYQPMPTLDVLLPAEPNLLLPDHLGRLPWHFAVFFGQPAEIHELILERTRAQAEARDFDLGLYHQQQLQVWIGRDWFNRVAHNLPSAGPEL